MPGATIDKMIEFALQELLSGGDAGRRALVRRMCEKWPSASAQSVVFAICNAASMIEETIDSETDPKRLAAFGYKLAALVSADIYALQEMGKIPATAHDLLHFWRRVDGYFLEL